MQAKVYIVISIILLALVGLIIASTSSNAKAVVTVEQVLKQNLIAQKVQIGARLVNDSEIEVSSEPVRTVLFWVSDRQRQEPKLKVVYHGVMPDTLKPGRDVIIQGEYDGQQFNAHQLLTQCPSKYEPPKVDGGNNS